MALSRMSFTIIHHFAGSSDLLGIILRKSLVAKKQAKKVGAPGSCFELRSRAGRICKRFVQRHSQDSYCHCHFSQIQ
jgi:hypothetical protein